jgi:uncharacterized double-CXXCG motif protein
VLHFRVISAAFLLKPHPDDWREPNAPQFEASHAFGLPGLDCPSCTPWAVTGVQYPSVDPDLLRRTLGDLESWPVPVAEFEDIREKAPSLVDATYIIEPGTKFGPLCGRVSGKVGDFVWPNPWTLLVRERIMRQIGDAGLSLVSGLAELQFEDGTHEPLIEIEAVPRVSLASYLVPDPCAICGRRAVSKPNRMALQRATFDDSLPIQRIVELPTFIVVNQALAEFLIAQGPVGLAIDRINFADH